MKQQEELPPFDIVLANGCLRWVDNRIFEEISHRFGGIFQPTFVGIGPDTLGPAPVGHWAYAYA